MHSVINCHRSAFWEHPKRNRLIFCKYSGTHFRDDTYFYSLTQIGHEIWVKDLAIA